MNWPRRESLSPCVIVEGPAGCVCARWTRLPCRSPVTAANAAAVRRSLQAWLLDHGRKTFGAWLPQVAAQTGFAFGRLQVRRQRTRWGSCSLARTISLNCCLLFQRPEVVRYLLVHELAHTRHMNHSARFWRLVATHVADYRRLDRELVQGWQNVPSWVFVS
ncbi:MAG: M48 family metallopeptidase [Gammaproteobacteria bacterium]|nr:M48 family metallopeptidase [Gammaproteobacteria bacterium]